MVISALRRLNILMVFLQLLANMDLRFSSLRDEWASGSHRQKVAT
jgi:hypothetical protein